MVDKKKEEKEFEPFGPEWEAEVVRLNKDVIIGMYKRVCLEKMELKEEIARLVKAERIS